MRLLTAGSLVRVQLGEPRRGEPFGSPRFCTKTRLYFIGCRSFLAKGHVRAGYSLASAHKQLWLTANLLRLSACGAAGIFFVRLTHIGTNYDCLDFYYKKLTKFLIIFS